MKHSDNKDTGKVKLTPTNVIIENMAMATPRSIGSQMSARTPGELDMAQLTNVPERNRPTSRLPKFGAKAQRKLKAMKIKKVM